MHNLADHILALLPSESIPHTLKSYIQGETPISTWPAVMSMTVTYLTVVFGTREIMKHRSPLKLTTLFRAHNLLLCVASLVLMTLLAEEVVSNWMKVGTYGIICSQEAYTPRLEIYFLINYYFKYYEFVDTVFLAMKKKPLTFLHVYHHAATAVLAFVQLNARATVCWVAALLNLGVHVIMYYYYFATAGGARFWWKRHLTTLQIIQFIIILASAAFASYNYAAHNWWPVLPHVGNCSGTPAAGIIGGSIVMSYLLLFVDFFYQTYMKNPQTKRALGSHNTTSNHKRSKSSGTSSGSLLLRVDSTT
ncbi:GNS1/SUR4 membrane protein [Scleroderma citrinum]